MTGETVLFLLDASTTHDQAIEASRDWGGYIGPAANGARALVISGSYAHIADDIAKRVRANLDAIRKRTHST
jgi:hypothetical protein